MAAVIGQPRLWHVYSSDILQLRYSTSEVSPVLKGFTSLCKGGKSICSHLAQRVTGQLLPISKLLQVMLSAVGCQGPKDRTLFISTCQT